MPKKKKLRIISLCSLLALAFNSCGLGGQEGRISFEGVRYALYFSPNHIQLGDYSVFTADYGYVALVDEQGEYQLIKNDGMSTGDVIWGSANELSFADRSHNYIVRENSVEKFEASKTNLQNDIAVSDGRYISTFNLGGKIGEYKNEFTLVDAQGVQLETIPESVESLATCPDGRVIGGGGNRGSTLNPGIDDLRQIVVLQVYDGENLTVEPLWNYTSPDNDSRISYSGLVCTSDSFYLLIYDASNENISSISLASVDLETGKADIKPLVSNQIASGVSVSVVADNLYESRYLDWFSGGYFYRTDIFTGVTQVLVDTEGRETDGSGRVDVDENFFYKVDHPEDDFTRYTISRYDRADGSLADRVETVSMKEIKSMGQYGFAVRPSP